MDRVYMNALKILKLKLSLSNIDPFNVFKNSAKQSRSDPRLQYDMVCNNCEIIKSANMYEKLRKFLAIFNPSLAFLTLITHVVMVVCLRSNVRSPVPCDKNQSLDSYQWLACQSKKIGTDQYDSAVILIFSSICVKNLFSIKPINSLMNKADLAEIRLLFNGSSEINRIDNIIRGKLDMLQTSIYFCRRDAMKAYVRGNRIFNFGKIHEPQSNQLYQIVMQLLQNDQQRLSTYRTRISLFRPISYGTKNRPFHRYAKFAIFTIFVGFLLVDIYALLVTTIGFYLGSDRSLYDQPLILIQVIMISMCFLFFSEENSGFASCFWLLSWSHHSLVNDSILIAKSCLSKLRNINEIMRRHKFSNTVSTNDHDVTHKIRIFFMIEAHDVLTEASVKLLVHITELKRCSYAASAMLAFPFINMLNLFVPEYVGYRMGFPLIKELIYYQIIVDWVIINSYALLFLKMSCELAKLERLFWSIRAENAKLVFHIKWTEQYNMSCTTWTRLNFVVQESRDRLIPRVFDIPTTNNMLLQTNFIAMFAVLYVTKCDLFNNFWSM